MNKVLLNKDSLTGRRIGAFLIDHILITLISMIPFLINFEKLSKDSDLFHKIFPFAMFVGLVGFLCKDVICGRSIGKLLFGIYVREYGSADSTPKFYRLILRNVFVLIWFVEFIIMLTDKEGRRIGDKVAKAQVIGYQNNIVAGIVITALLAISLFVPSLVIGVTQIIKNDAAYKTAIHYIENKSEITDAVGEIQGFGFFPAGNVSYSNGYGDSRLNIKVNGTQKSIFVSIYLERKPHSDWVVKYIDY